MRVFPDFLQRMLPTIDAVCLLVAIVFTGVAVKDRSARPMKVTGSFLIAFLATKANHSAVYAVAIFLVATLITKLDFIENIAAIFWRSKEFFDYRKAFARASDQEKTRRIQREVAAEPELHAGDGVQESVRRVMGLEERILALAAAFFASHNGQLTTGVKVRTKDGRETLIDAVADTPLGTYLVEVKTTRSAPSHRRAVDELRRLLDAYRAQYRPEAWGIVIVPSESELEDRVDYHIAALKYDDAVTQFVNAGQVSHWMQLP
jgi:hypothetical protein